MKLTKKTVVAASLATLMAASAQAANDVNSKVYGSLRIGVDSIDAKTKDDGANGRDFLSRVGVKADQKINDSLTVTGQLEYGIGADFGQKSSPELRLANVGLKGDFGSVTFGSQTTLWHKFVRGAYFSDGNDSLRQGTIRDDDLIQYYYKNGGLTLGAGTQVEGRDGDDFDQYMLGGEYKMGALKLQAAYSKDNRGDNKGDLIGARAWYKITDAVTVSALTHQASKDYDLYGGNSAGNVKTASLKNPVGACAEDRTTNAAYAQYKFGSNMVHTRYAVNSCDNSGDATSVKVEYVRYVTKKFRTWVSYEDISLDDKRKAANGAAEDSISAIQLGTRFDF